MVIIVPHQDDELFCYSMLRKADKLIVVFKGGGEPKGYRLDPETLYKYRSFETLKTCDEFNLDVEFLNIQRPYEKDFLEDRIEKLFKIKFDAIITTMPVDYHEDHSNLGNCIKKYYNGNLYGFIVHTNTLIRYMKDNDPDIIYNLNDNEIDHRYNLAINYKTQKHFLLNVIRRKIYNIERYWRIENCEI